MAPWQKMKKPEGFTIAVEGGADGWVTAWCLELPGCFAIVPPGSDILERARLAILEFTAWSHNRAADRLVITPEELSIVQRCDTGENVREGDGSAFFIHDAEAPQGREFPLWANSHDLAMDELSSLALTMPPALMADRLDADGRSLLGVLQHVANSESWYADQLKPKSGFQVKGAIDSLTRDLRDAHTVLQQVVCDVPQNMRVRRDTAGVGGGEDWSVRKVMRRSIWHIRYHTWELRRALSGIWLA